MDHEIRLSDEFKESVKSNKSNWKESFEALARFDFSAAVGLVSYSI